MATTTKKTTDDEIDTTYATNLAQTTAAAASTTSSASDTATVDTSYQTNTNTLYGGHNATWWQQQYTNADDNQKSIISKAAQYYGYQIPESVSTTGTTASTDSVDSSYATNATALTASSASTTSAASTTSTTTSSTDEANTEETTETSTESSESSDEDSDSNVWSYEEYLESLKQQSIESAEATRQRTIADARSSYEQNKATYGSNAETLASMGLTGSGYSDYINAQAYASQRDDIQTANALAESEKTEATQSADNALAEYKLAQEETQNSSYAELLSYANSDTYTLDQLKNFASTYNLSDEQIESIVSQYQSTKYNTYSSAISDGTASTSDIDKAYANGDISEEQYNTLKDEFNSSIQSSTNSSATIFADMDYYTATDYYNDLLSSSWLNDETKSALEVNYSKYILNNAASIAQQVASSTGLDASNVTSTVVNIYASAFSNSNFGDFAGSETGSGSQGSLINAYVAAAKSGKIEVGQICVMNYGAAASSSGYYIYLGNGVFVAYTGNKSVDSSKVYIPDGYKYTSNKIYKK